MNLKTKLKQIPLFYLSNSLIKAKIQERIHAAEYSYYSKRQNHIFHNGNISDQLNVRLRNRGITPVPKRKGQLHIFLTYGLNNWESVLPVALKSFGRVSEFEWNRNGFNVKADDWVRQRDRMNKTMLDYFDSVNSEEPVDAVVSYLTGYTCDPEIIRKIGAKGAVVYNFCWDDKLYFRGKKVGNRWSGPAAIASAVDLNLTNSPESIIKYNGEDGLSMFWPEGAHQDIHKHYDLPYEYDVSVLGGCYGWRPIFVKKLIRIGVNVACFGNGWPNGPLNDEDSVKLFSKSRINLGFSGVGHSKKLMCLKGRDFEVPMSGGLYLTQDNPELSLIYNIDNEIVTYKNLNDCYEKICWLLDNPDIAQRIRLNGRERALKDHTWGKRFDELFTMAGLI